MFVEIVLIAYIIDMIFGEFSFIKHPVMVMGSYISWFEKHYYEDSFVRGMMLTLSLISLVGIGAWVLSLLDNVLVQGFLASFTLASKMLFDEVKKIINASNPKEAIAMLVSRDTSNMSQSDINKASIETYGENLSDGVIAPLFYLLCFGLIGAYVYKAINTLDSMIGYRNARYENFGKFAAKLDDVANYIPSRLTAVLISLLFASKKALFSFSAYGKRHESPNAGYPISAMALSLNISLGGPTSYFGKVKAKPYFGEGRKEILKEDVLKALSVKKRLDIFICVSMLVALLLF